MSLRREVAATDVAPSGHRSSSALGVHRPGIDGIRAVAVLAILGYHSGFRLVQGGFLAVSQFFTLSGFLITSILLRSDAAGGIGLATFWSRRFRRLMPAALACLVGVMMFGATVADRQQAEPLPTQVLAAATYWINWLFIVKKASYTDAFASPSPVQHFWSLAIEEQFYVVLPIAVFLVLRRRRSTLVLLGSFGALVLASTVWMAHLYRAGAGIDRIYYGTDTRLAEMLVGSVLAIVVFRRNQHVGGRAQRILAVASTVAFAVMLWFFTSVRLADGWLWTGGLLGFSAVSATLIMGVLGGRGPVAWLFSARPLASIGRISYGLYLYHWPIFLWLTPSRTGFGTSALFVLRMAVTFAIAVVSYHLLERPIRDGAPIVSSSRLRLAAAPVAVIAIVAGTFISVDRSAVDPLATLRNDSSLTPPGQPADRVLDLLVITDEPGPGVIDRIEQEARKRAGLRVTRTPFSCSSIVTGPGGRTCANWASSWPTLIADHDPDVVLVYVDDWPAADIAQLSGTGPAEATTVAQEVLGNGIDILTDRGAKVVFASSGADFGTLLARSSQPFAQAIANLESKRSDVRHVLGNRLPDPKLVTRSVFVERSSAALLTDAALYQRAGSSDLPRVLVLGDSQAISLGYGLERWANREHRAVVWNAASEGCGIIYVGTVRSGPVEEPVSQRCRDVAKAWTSQVTEFEPDVVIVLSSLWDLQTRRVPGWTDFREPTDASYGRFLLSRYAKAVDTFSAEGAKVIWLTAPCLDAGSNSTTRLNQRNIDRLNRSVLPALAGARPEQVRLFDLDAVLCPDGRYRRAIGGVDPVRIDGVHFSVEGSLWFADSHGAEVLGLATS